MHADLEARVARVCERDLPPRELRRALVDAIASAVPVDAHVWLLTDPVTGIGTSPMATIPGLAWPHLPDLIRARYLTPINRWTTMAASGVRAESLCRATAGDLTRSGFWRATPPELLVSDVTTLVFADRFGVWGWLDLWRTHASPAFTDAEIELLATSTATITKALRRSQAATFDDDEPRATTDATTTTIRASGPAVLILGPDLQIRGETAEAVERLVALNPPDPGSAVPPDGPPAIPAAAYNVAAALISREQGVGNAPPRARVHVDGAGWLTVEAARMSSTGGPSADDDIAVTIEPAGLADRREVFACAVGLTPRESEVLGLLLRGNDNRAIAEHLWLSAHTVNDHVKALLAKSGCPGRGALAARVSGGAGEHNR